MPGCTVTSILAATMALERPTRTSSARSSRCSACLNRNRPSQLTALGPALISPPAGFVSNSPLLFLLETTNISLLQTIASPATDNCISCWVFVYRVWKRAVRSRGIRIKQGCECIMPASSSVCPALFSKRGSCPTSHASAVCIPDSIRRSPVRHIWPKHLLSLQQHGARRWISCRRRWGTAAIQALTLPASLTIPGAHTPCLSLH